MDILDVRWFCQHLLCDECLGWGARHFRKMGRVAWGGGLLIRKGLLPRPHCAIFLVTVTRNRASRTSPFASSCEICGHSSAKSMFSCIQVTQIIDDLMQHSRTPGVRLRFGDVQNLWMPKLTKTFGTFAGSVSTYFVTSVSAEVRDTSSRWVGSRGGSLWKLLFMFTYRGRALG